MSNVLAPAIALTVAVAGLVAADPRVRPDDKKPEPLALKSGYSGKVLVDGACRVALSVSFDGKGGGSGTLTLDPNIRDGLGSTQIAVKEVAVRARLVRDDESAAKGRRLYELKPTDLEGGVDERGERWLLVKPVKEGAPCWLVFEDKDGKVRDVVMIE